MALTLPTPSVSTGPTWASTLNTALTTIDGHDHSSMKGVPVPVAGLNINADLPLTTSGTSYNVTGLRSARFTTQSAALSLASDVTSLYVSGNNLFYNNGSGAAVQITSGATLSATSLGGISGLPSGTASASFGSATFTWRSATNAAATMDGGPLVIRDTAASALGITIVSPASLVAGYSLTLPTALPSTACLLALSAAGVISAPSSAVTANTQRITNVVDPSGTQDAATKNYVDNPTLTNLTDYSLGTGWTTGTAGGYIKDRNFVQMKGVFNSTSTSTTVLTMPSGTRPIAGAIYRFLCWGTLNGSTGAHLVSVNSSGVLTSGDPVINGDFIDLSPVRYPIGV